LSEIIPLVKDQLSPLGEIRARAMFGGHGIYCDNLFFALVADDTLYLKADDVNRGEFEARGLGPFVYEGKGKPIAMSYFRAPDELFEDRDAALHWGASALDAARRAAARKRPT
jgi:DNA transformation protein